MPTPKFFRTAVGVLKTRKKLLAPKFNVETITYFLITEKYKILKNVFSKK